MSRWRDCFFIDNYDPANAYRVHAGPFTSLDMALEIFNTLPATGLTYRLRGPGNTVWAETYNGNAVRYQKPRTFWLAR
jgi:hypothetical protein